MMSSETVNLNTRAHSYDPPLENKPDDIPSEKPSTSTTPPLNGLHIEKPTPEAIFCPPKGVDVFVTLKCIKLYILCIAPRCLFWEVSVM